MRRWRNFTVVMVTLAAQALFAHEVRLDIWNCARQPPILRCVMEGAGGGHMRLSIHPRFRRTVSRQAMSPATARPILH
jgi:hypothetical protein